MAPPSFQRNLIFKKKMLVAKYGVLRSLGEVGRASKAKKRRIEPLKKNFKKK